MLPLRWHDLMSAAMSAYEEKIERCSRRVLGFMTQLIPMRVAYWQHLLRGRDYVLDDFFAKLWVVLRSLQNRVVFLGEKTLTGDSPHRPRKSIEPLVRNAHSLHVHRRSQPARSGADQQDESNCGLREHGWPLRGRRS